MENTRSNFEPVSMEEINKAFREAIALINDYPKKIHMTSDFYNKLRVSLLVELKKGDDILFLRGIPVEIHTEPCEKEYWFGYQDKIKNAAYGWHYNELSRTLYKAVLVNTTTGE